MNQSLSGAGAELTASYVRDELYARKALEANEEEERRVWNLVDPVEEAHKKSQDSEINRDNKENQEGLRQRKKKAEIHKSDWTTELLSEDDAEQVLRQANPIDLFGAFPSRDLRSAQKDAEKALQHYVDAAN
eukprot:CAMPEP_0194247698 /NCGR_PEP_ID=MMETSP0158-20130606/16973_1 /TAXON_ID=33649 /ORGANISM="Thalassionema nitzschioides, Strain L26-B" /LENGTH=131 /DNA_ID=CAMNT_0038983827 /DNA_START=190 /DNA_END=582 /DNA_ORIENTATION=-